MENHHGHCGPKAPGTVVIVDDDPMYRDSLRILLETMGFEALCFATGSAMLGSTDLPDEICFLLDYHLPDGTGLDIMTVLNSRADNPRIGPRVRPRMVLISGNADPAIKQRARDQGAIAALDKPVNDDCLLAILETAFHA